MLRTLRQADHTCYLARRTLRQADHTCCLALCTLRQADHTCYLALCTLRQADHTLLPGAFVLRGGPAASCAWPRPLSGVCTRGAVFCVLRQRFEEIRQALSRCGTSAGLLRQASDCQQQARIVLPPGAEISSFFHIETSSGSGTSVVFANCASADGSSDSGVGSFDASSDLAVAAGLATC